ncbi:hypothetical protein L9F63_014862, partial [Diploptera punctata]
ILKVNLLCQKCRQTSAQWQTMGVWNNLISPIPHVKILTLIRIYNEGGRIYMNFCFADREMQHTTPLCDARQLLFRETQCGVSDSTTFSPENLNE